MTIASATLLLILVMDPVGNVPFFMSALRQVAPERQRRVIVRELLIALAALLIFLFAGRYILALLQISEPALTISGGMILFLIALRMVFPQSDKSMQEEVDGEPFIVPLAIPYIAGPSAMATVLLLTSREPARWPEWLVALVLAWAVTGAAALLSGRLSRLLGKKGLTAMERLMGMVLITIAVQMLMTGVTEFRLIGGA